MHQITAGQYSGAHTVDIIEVSRAKSSRGECCRVWSGVVERRGVVQWGAVYHSWSVQWSTYSRYRCMWGESYSADSPPALGRNFGSYDPSISLMEADRLAASCLVRVQTSSSSSKDLQIGKRKVKIMENA